MIIDSNILGCHTPEDAERRRKKRQANNIDADSTEVLRQYFTNCLRSGVSLQLSCIA